VFVLPATVDKAVHKPRGGEDLLSHAAHAGWGKTTEDNKYALLEAGNEYNRYKRQKWEKNGGGREREDEKEEGVGGRKELNKERIEKEEKEEWGGSRRKGGSFFIVG